jgi:hypothetical protein
MDAESSSSKSLRFFRPSPVEWMCLIFGVFFSFFYSWVLDDAFIYFRYIDNLIFLKNGLVYNPGEFVEGFSSPFWALCLSFFRALGITYWTIIRFMGICSFVVFWALLVVANRKLSGDTDKPVVNVPLIYLTFSYSVMSYFTSGTETPLVLLCAGMYACYILFPESRVLQVFVGISPLIRHELLLPFALVLLWRFFSQKRFPWILFMSCVVSLGTWIVFRVVYYADFFPNTYYLKNEVSLLQGIYYLLDTILPYFTIPFLLFFFVAFKLLKKKEGSAAIFAIERLLMVASAALVAFYVIKVGGDARHFRFLAFPFCLVVISTGGLVERIFASRRRNHKYLYGIAVTIALAVFLCYPRQLINHPIFKSKDYKHTQFMKITESAVFRVNKLLPGLFSSGKEVESVEEKKEWALRETPISKESVIAFSRCFEAYVKYDTFVINSFGLTDPFLARARMPSIRPAHKYGLFPLAEDLVRVRKKYGFSQGAFRRCVMAREAPPWIENNLQSLEDIERKVYNTHNFWENLSLALKRTGKIEP